MRLSELIRFADIDVRRDAEFTSLALASDPKPGGFVCVYDARYIDWHLAGNPGVTAVLTAPALADRIPARFGLAVAAEPQRRFYEIHEHLAAHTQFYWTDFASEIARDASIDPSAVVAPRNVRIGAGTRIGPRAVVQERSLIGAGCVIGPGCIVGADGFDPRDVGGTVRVTTHAGGVEIDDRVEIQAGGVVCRAVFKALTRIGADTVIGVQSTVSHGVQIGRRCRLAPRVCVCGSSRLGDDVRIGPNATICNRITIGDGARITLGSVVVRDVATGSRVTGNFAVAHDRFKRHQGRLEVD